MSFASDQHELQLAGAVSATDQQQFPAFRRNEDSLSEQQPRDHTLGSHPSDSRSVGETIFSPAHQPAVDQTHSNYLSVYAGLTTEPQTNKGFDTTESAMKVEPLQNTTQVPQMDSPLVDRTLPMNQTSVCEISLNSDSSINKSSNYLPETETSTSNVSMIDKPPPNNHPTMGTAPLSSHPPLHEPPSSHHSPGDGTLSSNQPPVDRTSPNKHPPAGGASPSSHPPMVYGTSPINHSLVDKTSPSSYPPMTYIAPLSSHSPADEYQPSEHEPADGILPSIHPTIIDGASTNNHPSGDKTTNNNYPPMGEPPLSKHPLTDFCGSQQPLDDFPPSTQPPVEVLSRIDQPAECDLQKRSEFPASSTLLLDQTPPDHLAVCKIFEFFSNQVSINVAQLSYQPPADGKPCDKYTQHRTPSIKEVLHGEGRLLKTVGLSQSTPILSTSSSIQIEDEKQQLFRSSRLSLTEDTDIIVPTDGDKEGIRFNLHHACMIGDGDMTQRILKSGTNPNVQDICGYTALHYACRGGHFACINSLLCHSDNPVALFQVPSNDGATPLSIRSETSDETLLHLACNSKDEFVLKKLLEAGADPNVKDNSGLTPLMSLVLSSVVSSDTSELVAALYSHGCNLNAALEVSETNLELQSWNGWTALHMAMGKQPENVDSDCIKSLISCGASIQATDAQGHTPLHIACIVGYFDNLDLLAPNEDYFQINDSSGCMPLYYVCRYGHCEYVRKVLSHSPKNLLQAVNTDGATPLTVVDEEGRTILHHACREGYDDVTLDLLEAGVDPSIKDSQGFTPLHYACENGHNKCIHAIFYSSMNSCGLPEIKDANGRIPLHIACMQQHRHIIEALNPSHEHFVIEDNDGCTPLYYICTQGDCLTKISGLLDETPGVSSLLTAKVTANGATPLTIVDEEGRAFIHHACKKGDEDLTLHLLKAGADPTVQDSQGNTPLHYACEGGHIKCLNHLLDFSQNPARGLDIVNNHGTSALHMQMLAGDQGILHLVCERKDGYLLKRLLVAGANANLPDGFGFTPLMRVLIGKAVNDSDALRFLHKSKSSVRIQSSSAQSMEGNQSLTMCKETKLYLSCIEHLISFGASLVYQDAFGRSALHIACIFGHSALLHLLAPNGDCHHMLTKDSSGCTPLFYLYNLGHCACSRNILAEFPTSLQNTPNGTMPTHLSAVDKEGQTLLHYACRKGYNSLTADLLKAGADPTVQDSQGNTPLHYVCERGIYIYSIHYLYNFINKHTDSHTLWQIQNSSGVTPLSMHVVGIGKTMLHLACEKQDYDLIRRLLVLGADPNAIDASGFTPLMRVITMDGITDHAANVIVTILCVFNCDITLTLSKHVPSTTQSTQIWEGTALHMAAKVGSKPSCVGTLTAQCTTAVDIGDPHDRIPLHIATLYGHHNLINFLAPHPKYFLIKDNSGCTPLYYACRDGNYRCVHSICQQIADNVILNKCIQVANNDGITPLTVKDRNGRTILHHALLGGDGNLACKLLRAGADPTVKDHSGITPLTIKSHNKSMKNRTLLHHLCCKEGNFDLIVELLKAGADANAKDDNGYTPLMLALRYINDTDASGILLSFCDFQHEISDCVNSTSLPHSALHIATECNKAECVKLLTEKGADLLAKNSNGKNPLHIACMKGHGNLVAFLLTDKSIEVKDITGSTPLHYACKYGHIECVRKIISVMENDHLKALFQMADLEGVTPLKGSNNQGETILHHTCAAHDLSLLQDLLRYGACPNAQDNAGLTPLMTALKVDLVQSIEKLLLIINTFILSIGWDPYIKDGRGQTVLHYTAGYEDVRIAYTLLVAGCDTSVEDDNGQTFSNLMPRKSLQLLSKQLLRIDRRQIVCVIGYPKSGKTTLIAAFKQVPRSTLQKVSTFFQNDRITLTDTRTAGIDTKTFSDDKLGNIVFFDFAGQSEYYASHLAFLESALAPKGAAITFIMVVDLRLAEEEKFRQCMEWLFPIKSIVKEHNVLNVVLIGSHQDQLKSGASTAAVQSLYTTMQKLKTTLSTPYLQFVDCWGMDCRRLSSKGMARLQEYLKSRHSSYNSDEGRHAPIGASFLFHKLKNLDNPPLAITPCMIIDRLKDGHHPFPLTVKYIDRCCQDLSAAGIALYFLDREDASKSWLILEIEEILGGIHGKLFAPDHTDFPMHHKNLANQFGLVQTDELKVAFKHSPLDPDMVQRLLMSMEFCHPIDSSLMKEGTNRMHIGLEIDQDVVEGQLSFFLAEADFQKNWLFFPSLVKVDRGITMSTECDVSTEDCHWICWELSTVNPHFLTPRFQQAIFFQLACNYVPKHKSVLSSVEEHSCVVGKNTMSWSTIHGVDVCVQIKYKSTVNVTARSRPRVKVSFLMELIANVVSDILTVRANHSPGVDVFSVLRVMDKGTPTDHTVPISSIIASIEENGSHVNCREQPLKLISLKDLFQDWEVSTMLLKKMLNLSLSAEPSKMDFSTTLQCHAGTATENKHTQQSTDDVKESGSFKDPSLPDLYSAILQLISAGTVKTSWKVFAQKLGVFNDLIQKAEKITGDIYDCSGKYKVQYYQECLYLVLEAWMMKEEGTGDLPRTWETVYIALEDSGIPIPAARVEESLKKKYLTLLRKEVVTVTEADLLDLVKSQAYEKWNEFAINLGVQQNIREEIAFDSQRVAKDNFIEVVYRWLSREDGTGDNPRTWITVIRALGEIGCPVPLETLKRKLLQYQKSNGDSIAKNDSESSQQIPNDQEDTVAQTNLKEHFHEEESTKEISTTVAKHSQEGGVNSSGPQQNQKSTYIHVKPSEEQLVQLVGSQMCAKWNMFSLYLGVQKHVRDEVSHNCQRMAKACFTEVIGRWLFNDDGTGDSPRTWKTVSSALRDIGHTPLAEEVEQKLCQSGALAKVLEEKSHHDGTSEAIRNDSEDMQVVINEPSSLNFVQTEAKQDDLPSLLENIDREEITTRPCPVVTIQEQLPCELESPTTSVEDKEDDCDTQQKQIFLQVKPTEEELARFVSSQMCAEWNTFSVYLGVQKHVRDKVCYNCSRIAEDCFIEVVGRWLSYEDGTGVNCRTWETVFSALKGAGYPLLVEEVKQKLSNRQKSA